MGGRRALAALGLVALLVAAAVPAPSLATQRSGLSLSEKAAQLVVFSIEGTRLSKEDRRALSEGAYGGIILFQDNYDDPAQLASFTDQIQRAARSATEESIGALISVDQEGGVVKRFDDMPPWRSAPDMGSTGDPSVAYAQGRKTGVALREAGVNVNLAPVADLDLPPEHVMRSRSFGSRPHRVKRFVRAFADGLQRKGVAATLKHFPGLGGATINTDYGRSYVRRSKRQLHQIDAVPFHYAIDNGAKLVMLSHALYLNDGGKKPASMSRYIATGRLRGEFGFAGAAISDALEAVAWRFRGSVPKACAATVRAGVDIALVTGGAATARACAAAIRSAVREGAISRARLDEAVTRVLALKSWLGLYDAPTP